MKKIFKLLFFTALLLIYMVIVRRWMNGWGSREEELDEDLPGDWMIGDKLRATRAIMIGSGIDEVWPWIAQLGRGAGYYAWDYITNPSMSSADYLLPDLPEPAVGDRNDWMGTIVAVEPKRSIVWVRQGLELMGVTLSFRVSYFLREEGEDACRLMVRNSSDWDGPFGWIAGYKHELLGFGFYRRQLLSLKALVEGYRRRREEDWTNRHYTGSHQAETVEFGDDRRRDGHHKRTL